MDVLIIEDSEGDAALMLRQFHQHGLTVSPRLVSTMPELEAALANNPPDVVIADYSLPSGDGLTVLRMVRTAWPDIPFVFVSGALGEEAAIATLKAGANDYLMKSALNRLVPVMERAIRESEDHRARLQADAALRESEAKFQLLFASHPHPMWLCDVQSLAIIEVNAAAVAVYGYTRETFLRMHLTDIEVGDAPRPWLLAAQRGPTRLGPVEGRHRLNDGREIEVEISAQLLVDRDQPAALIVAHDITQRKAAESALRASQARYQAIVEDQSDLIIRYQSDHTLLFVNSAYAQYMGSDPTQLVGARHLHAWVPEDAEFVDRKRAHLAPDAPPVTYWGRVRLPNGELRWQQWTERALRESFGPNLEYQAVGQDITDRKKAEFALMQSHAELATLNALAVIINLHRNLETLLPAIMETLLTRLALAGGWVQLVARASSEVLLASERGLPPAVAAWLGQHGRQLLSALEESDGPTASASTVASTLVQALEEAPWEADPHNPPAVFAVPLRSKNRVLGILGAYRREGGPITASQSQILAALGYQLGTAIDNIQLTSEAAEVEISRAADRLRSELIANVSHELRTPLGLITVMSSTLLREDVTFDPDVQRGLLTDILDEAQRLSSLVDNVLNLSRLRSRQWHPDRRWFDLAQLVTELLANLQPHLPHHRLVNSFAPEPLPVYAEAKRIEQVWRNLLDNAVKYSPAGSAIEVGGGRQGNSLLVWVRDHGVGLASPELERIFESFYRIETPGLPGVDGVGLGLAICREIVTVHGGRIWVESVLGAGSTFYFSLPAGPPAGATGEDE
ncbi:MAG: PAS domain S-box protein [Anaerolineales bacterium]